ncbi:MAG TPA: NTP transferase domain-containing protein, partial [Acidobacteriota bacterium]
MYGLILAAGESIRIGSPKALLKIGSETFVERIVNILQAAGIQQILIVAGVHYEQIHQEVRNIKVIFNSQYQHGQFSSLQSGLREIPKQTDFVIVWPVDLPLVQKETI